MLFTPMSEVVEELQGGGERPQETMLVEPHV